MKIEKIESIDHVNAWLEGYHEAEADIAAKLAKEKTEQTEKTEPKSITKQFEEIISQMCDKYCKYPNQVDDEDELEDICENCPLNRLL